MLTIEGFNIFGPNWQDFSICSYLRTVSHFQTTSQSDSTQIIWYVIGHHTGITSTLTEKILQIREYRFLTICYESTVDWKPHSDYLRCSPRFHNHPRYDCVIVSTVDRIFFAQLIFVFSCAIDNSDMTHSIALIHPFDTLTSTRNQLDNSLHLIRLQKRSPTLSEFISVQSIIRGALIMEDIDNPGNALIIDTVDP